MQSTAAPRRPHRTWWRAPWLRPAGGAAILALLVWRLGTGPFLDGLRTLSWRPLAAAAGIAVVTTVCSAWRWRLVAQGLGVALPLRSAVAAYYRSQFLNTALPGGVLGDVERAVRHGRHAGDLSRGLRAVWWERVAGQCTQVGLVVVVLVVLPSPVRPALPLMAALAAAAAIGAAVVAPRLRRVAPLARIARASAADVRDAVLSRGRWPGIVAASVVVVAGHTATFLLAARTAGATASLTRLLPLAMLMLLAMTVPLSIGGWGPREGAAAWVFAAAGLGAGSGIAAATVYGVLVVFASLPGAVVLLASRRRHGDAAEVAPAAETRRLVVRPVHPAEGTAYV